MQMNEPPMAPSAPRPPAFASLAQPQAVALSGRRVLVLGLGDSGLSAARWVVSEGGSARVADSRAEPPRLAALLARLPSAQARCGPFSSALLDEVDLVCVSPGLSLEEPLLREAAARSLPVLGDIELFAWGLQRHARQPGKNAVLAITGTNGKTTVTALTGHLLREAGMDVAVAGNISPPALDALADRLDAGRLPDTWVLELSSYQLETTWSLAPAAAAMLNLSEDHLDRYGDLAAYAAAKARVFQGEGAQVLNRDDAASLAMAVRGRRQITFGLGAPSSEAEFGCIERGGERWIARGDAALLPVAGLQIHGLHNASNAMAALALALAAGAPAVPLAQAATTFRGLPHRLEHVAQVSGVDYYDDSKGTNVGATIAALQGIGLQGDRVGTGASQAAGTRPVVLIAGGVGKGQDFGPLAAPVARFARRVLLIGEDAERIERSLAASGVPVERCASLQSAVESAARNARAGDAVLLSPACASFDMFRDYKQRGEAFAAAVEALEGRHG